MSFSEVDHLSVNTIRTLSIDAVEKANSGHPGLPMGSAPMAYVLWTRFLNQHPEHSNWSNRDRFVLSAGHGSMLLYSLLHLFGYDLSLDDLKQFRQWGSKTPGHPEYGHTQGVEATTGPLGQGIANSVGMAMAEKFLSAKYNKDSYSLVNHYTYALCGDGDLMEGVASEAVSLAGHLQLGKLIVLYDSNDISLDGPTDWSFTEDVKARFTACGWDVLRVEDGNDLDEIEAAIVKAKEMTEKPTLIEVKTTIGFGAPNKQGTSKAHGSPLGEEEAKLAKETYKWSHESFFVPDEVQKNFAEIRDRNLETVKAWDNAFEAYGKEYPEEAQEFVDALHGRVNVNWAEELPVFTDKTATRDAFGKVINAVAPSLPTLLGGSADLSGSNKTLIADAEHFGPENYAGANVFYGVREHAMGAAMNGICLHGGVIPYAGTFLVFSDYLRPSIRLAALMKQPALYVFTHDSIAVGEDGPTHEPVEQVAGLRSIPGLLVFRPADGTETAQAVRYALEHRDRPVALALTRQKLPSLQEVANHEGDFGKGAYVLYESGSGDPLVLLASGSEVNLVLDAAKKLAEQGQAVRVVNVTSMELFDEQDKSYREQVLPPAMTRRLAVEMAHPMPWYKYVGLNGRVLGIDRFGASAPGDTVVANYGFTVENVLKIAAEIQ
ncbi:transketolase [Alicyclobacillus sp. SO9]|uniref:transketolase n=1 Tax=Alicyclobacillus sp. SO9 TaxID=2665646 RepID=UPI0018E81094|nr:transketolase [Alicyclobacillus sp. SO9]QQE80214.1 transketolase [Alicyclobacillus sp. SO9]